LQLGTQGSSVLPNINSSAVADPIAASYRANPIPPAVTTSPVVTSTSLPNGQQGTAYSATLTATGGTIPYSWSISAGALPIGLSLNGSTGAISGTPTGNGTSSFTVKVTDSTTPTAQTATKSFTITVAAAVTPLQITTSSLSAGQVGVAYSTMLQATGGTTPYSWSITVGALPAGLSLTASTGVISGTPTTSGAASFTVRVTDAASNTASQALSIVVAAAGPQLSPTVSPTNPVLNQGGSVTFSCVSNCGTGGTWSCSGCAGSIDSTTGVYTAPATVTAKQSVGGYQLLPNNHIFNTRVDSLPVNANSATWIAASGSITFNYLPSFPLNYANGSTPTESEVFAYTPANDGTFQIPAFPYARIESGWLNARQYNIFNADHHLIVIDSATGNLQEMYQYYPVGSNGPSQNNCPTCTSQSGIRYASSNYALPSATTDAAGLFLTPLILRLQEVEQAIATGETINHALRLTLPLGYCASGNIWPATTFATDGGTIPFGARFRLKSSYNISGFSPIAQILLTQLKQYGLILADGGYGWQSNIEYTHWPKNIMDAMQSINNAGIAPSNFEAVDESGLEISSTSGEANTNRETVTFTRTSDSATATMDVILQGVAVGLPQDVIYIMPGSPNQTFAAYVNIGGVTWSMSPSVGSLTSGGLYIPPSTSATLQSTTVTATSTTNSSVAASMTVVILPQISGVTRLVPGATSDYTDSGGNVWFAGPLGNGDASCNPGTESCFGYGNGGSWSGTDILLYERPIYAANDLRYDITVPIGTYQITAKLANNTSGGGDQGNFVIESQGTDGSVLDLFTSVGNNQPYDSTSTVTATNGQLSFVLRAVNTTGNLVAPFISALEIVQTGP
jgi:hypothetical protein